jgi:DNA-binding SARP family transcriptional activator
VEFRLLGSLEVRRDGAPVALGPRKQRALLALLLLHANRAVARERLIDDLWGERPPETAVASVQVYVSRLRKSLPDGVLLTRPPGYVLEVDPHQLDLLRFERLVADAREADVADAAALLREALELWRGPPLAEFASEPFARLEAARLEELQLATLEDRIEADLTLGRHRDLVGELEMLVASHPHRERLRAQLMLTLYRCNRQADALDAYRSARAALGELGLEPGEMLRQLERRILTHDPTLDPTRQGLLADERAPLPGPLVPESPFPFVGRDRELVTLREALARAERGEGGMVLITGEPGAGKTRLVREFAHEAAGRGALVLYGVSDAVVSTPYQPLREWIRFLLRACEPAALRQSLGADGGRVARLVPELARLGISATESGDADADRYLLQSATVDTLTRLGRARPLLLVADDLHWADAEMQGLLRRLARAAPEARVLVVAAYRDPGEEITPDLHEALADLARLDAVSRLRLGGLTADDIGAFVHASAEAEASPELASAIGALTDGTPLLVCELWRDLHETGGVELSDGGVRLSRPVAELRGPERIQQAVQQRLSRLSVDALRMTELAAVAGARFELRVVGTGAGLGGAALTAAVAQSSLLGFVEELPSAVPTCRFTHELVRRAVYDPIPRVRRPELHLRVGEALEALHASDPGRVLPELAYHFTLAAPLAGVERAVDYNLRAAEAAAASAAYREAAERLSTALELGIADPRTRAEVQAELGNLYYESGRLGESDALLTASIETASELGERALAARALVHRSNQRLASDPEVSSADMLPIAEEAVRTFEQLADRRGLAAAEHLLAHALGREGRSSEAKAALDRALANADAVGDRVVALHIIGRRARQLTEGPVPAREAIEELEGLLPEAREDPALDAGLRRSLAVVLAMAGRFDEARNQLDASGPTYDDGVQTDFMLQGRWAGGDALELAGDVAGAEREFVGVFESLRDSRGDAPEARALRMAAHLALLLCDQGRWDDAAGYLAYGQHVDRAEPVQGKVYSLYRFAARGRLAARSGDLSHALHLVRLAVEVADRSSWLNSRARIWVAFAEAHRAAGRFPEADEAVATALALYDQKGNVAAAARLRAAVGSGSRALTGL